jgi:hypothetical protein
MYLVESNAGARKKVYVDLTDGHNSGNVTEIQFGSGEEPTFLGVFLDCVVIGTTKSVKYFIATHENIQGISNFSSWQTLASGSSVKDVCFAGSRTDIVGVAIVFPIDNAICKV